MSVNINIVPGESRLLDAMSIVMSLHKIENVVTTSPMDVGDICIKRGDDILCIMERKTGDDLIASITDGRYEEQKARMYDIKTRSGVMCIYVIEKLTPLKIDEPMRKATWTSIATTCAHHGMNVIITQNPHETAEFVVAMYKSLLQNNVDIPTVKVVDAMLKKKKVTPDDYFLHSLSLIKGVSVDVAESITALYKTFTALINAYIACQDDKSRNMLLANVVKKNGRKIGPVVSTKIWDFFQKQM